MNPSLKLLQKGLGAVPLSLCRHKPHLRHSAGAEPLFLLQGGTVPGWGYSLTRKVEQLFVSPPQSFATESNYSERL